VHFLWSSIVYKARSLFLKGLALDRALARAEDTVEAE